jgi:hypothetical protein
MRVDQVTGQLTVGQLASRTAVRADTVRYYEREGLLPVPQRTEGEHRRYGRADVDRLLFIRGAQRLGLRLAEIRELLAFDAFWGARYAIVADPDGNDVGLMSPIDESRRTWPPEESPAP